jgi:CRP/FNR family transcriptional regulator, cyclic AMP receptor protein
MGVVDDLAGVPIFNGVGREQLEALAKFAEERDVPAGAELTHEGRVEGSVFVVLSGSLAVERDGRAVDRIGPGELFGEIAAIDGGPRTATGRALEDSRVVVLSPTRFNDVLDGAPDLRATVMSEMERRLTRIDEEG